MKIYADRNYVDEAINNGLAAKADASHSHDDVYYTETEIDELIAAIPIGEPIVDITDKISNNSFDFSAVESGLYWTDSLGGLSIGGAIISGLFVVLKMADTVANVWAVHTGTIFVCNKGTISAVRRSLMTNQEYYDLTTTSKQILGAINELDAQLDSHGTAIAEAKAYAIPAPTTAQVGQTVVVKAVDENGKPTEWECVDPWVIASSTEGSTKKFKITVDDAGTLSVTEIIE